MPYAVATLRLDEHRGALARLWSENMSDPRIASLVPERMRWLYEEDPDGPPTTVLAVDTATSEPVGCGSFLQRPTWVDGARVRAGVLCDFAVTRAHRIGGAALTIQRSLAAAARAAGVELLYGYPNAKSVGVFKRVGYQVIGETRTYVKPLRAGYKLAGRVPGWALPVAAAPVDLALRALDAARALRPAGRARGDGALAPGALTDALWALTRARYGVVGERSAGYLAWRYGRPCSGDHRFFGARAPDGRLAGYAVYALAGDKAFLRDLLAEDLDEAAEGLLLALSGHLRGAGVQSIALSFVAPPAFDATLRRAGFLPRPGARPLVVHPECVPERLRARALDPASWFMLDGELDI